MPNPILHERLSKTCDRCSSRKVRCIRSGEPHSKCVNCQKRGEDCHFRLSRRRFFASGSIPAERPPSHQNPPSSIRTVSPLQDSLHSSTSPTLHSEPVNDTSDSPLLYIDHLIENHQATGRGHHLDLFFKANDSHVASASASYFSEGRIQTITKRLGNNGVESLIERISCIVNHRYERFEHGPTGYKVWGKPDNPPVISMDLASIYINSFFSQVHPVYPFLDRFAFETRASRPDVATDIATDIKWSALYYAVLALGCQYHGGGAFEPRKGESWKFYQMALGQFTDILFSKKTLLGIQAIVAMAIFALNFSYMHIDELLITEAARMAQATELNEASNSPERNIRYQTFWVIYTLEKTLAFNHAQTSIIMDSDIGCPIPTVPEAIFGDYNWLLASTSFARLTSRAYESLFSITATQNTEESYFNKIDVMTNLLERWRQSIPLAFRPGEPFRSQSFYSPCETLIALRTHFYYHDASIALCRLTLHVGKNRDGPRQINSKKALMQNARSIIELLRHIDMESYTPVYILALLPLSALFILFDLVIHNPTHSETSSNLALLEVAGGHFSRLEYATGGSLPSSILSEFAYLARTFVRSYEREHKDGDMTTSTSLPNDLLPNQQSNFGPGPSQVPNQTSGALPLPMDLQVPTPLLLPSFDTPPPDGGLLTGFNVMDLFGTAMPSDQDLFFDHNPSG